MYKTIGIFGLGLFLGWAVQVTVDAHREKAALPIALPPSTVIHPPMICIQGRCVEMKQEDQE